MLRLNTKVDVSQRTGPNENLQGGLGIITHIHEGSSKCYDIWYPVSKTVEIMVHQRHLKVHDWENEEQRLRQPPPRFEPEEIPPTPPEFTNKRVRKTSLDPRASYQSESLEEYNSSKPETTQLDYEGAMLHIRKLQKENNFVNLNQIAKDFGCQRTTLSRLNSGQRTLDRVGSKGRPPALNKTQAEVLVLGVAIAGTAGLTTSKSDFGFKLLEAAQIYGTVGSDTLELDPKTVRKYLNMGKGYEAIVKPRTQQQLDQQCEDVARNYLEMMQARFKILDYEHLEKSCPKQIPFIPSYCLLTVDEVAMYVYKDKDTYAIACKNYRPMGLGPGNAEFALTLVLTLCAAGFALPLMFCVQGSSSGNQITNQTSILMGLSLETEVYFTSSGSMFGGNNVSGDTNTMLKYAQFAGSKFRKIMGISEQTQIVLQMDNCSIHNDLEALKLFKSKNIQINALPPNTTSFLAVNDNEEINKNVQKERRATLSKLRFKGTLNRNAVLVASSQSVQKSLTRVEICKAFENCGFDYLEGMA